MVGSAALVLGSVFVLALFRVGGFGAAVRLRFASVDWVQIFGFGSAGTVRFEHKVWLVAVVWS